MTRFRLTALIALVLAPTSALAHHGQDFLLLESPTVPHPGNAYLLLNSHATLDGSEEQAGFEPALLLGLSPRLALELHAHSEKVAGESWRYEAFAPSVHVLLTDPGKHDGLKLGLSAEYEFARESDAADHLQLRFNAERGDERIKWAANLIYDRETGDPGVFGLAAGVRRSISANWALGVEAQGHFDHAVGSELLAGAYWEHGPRWTLKLGLGGERNDEGDVSPVAHMGLVLRLTN